MGILHAKPGQGPGSCGFASSVRRGHAGSPCNMPGLRSAAAQDGTSISCFRCTRLSRDLAKYGQGQRIVSLEIGPVHSG
jgi:hypothetical protein